MITIYFLFVYRNKNHFKKRRR